MRCFVLQDNVASCSSSIMSQLMSGSNLNDKAILLVEQRLGKITWLPTANNVLNLHRSINWSVKGLQAACPPPKGSERSGQ